MNRLAQLRSAVQICSVAFLATVVAPVVVAAPDPPGPCSETGPHSSVTCLQAGSYITPVRLTWTNQIALLGSAITPPTLIGPVFNLGKSKTYVYYDCDWNAYLNHYVTNDVIYQTNITFSPSFPSTATNLGTNQYSMLVNGTAVGGTCPALGYIGFTVKLIVWGNNDSDYDGVGDYQEVINGTDPNSPTNVTPMRLSYWPFNNTNTWVGSTGQLPLLASNIVGVASWNTNAARINPNTIAILKYRDVETNGNANINLRNGTIRFWFKPDWTSADQGGTGPQSEGRLIELGSKGSTNGWWGLLMNSNGTAITFGTQTNSAATLTTNLLAAVSWVSNQWHQAVLTYNQTNSSLYLDGQVAVTNGLGVTYYPGLSIRTNGFTIGSSTAGNKQAQGIFEDLETFNYRLNSNNIQTDYQAALNLDSDGDGIPNIIENQLGLNPYGYDSINGLNSNNRLQVFTPLK